MVRPMWGCDPCAVAPSDLLVQAESWLVICGCVQMGLATLEDVLLKAHLHSIVLFVATAYCVFVTAFRICATPFQQFVFLNRWRCVLLSRNNVARPRCQQTACSMTDRPLQAARYFLFSQLGPISNSCLFLPLPLSSQRCTFKNSSCHRERTEQG